MELDDQVVQVAQSDIEAQLLCAFLEAHDIPTTIKGEALNIAHGLDGLGMVEILVPSANADQARELIRLVEQGALALHENQEPQE